MTLHAYDGHSSLLKGLLHNFNINLIGKYILIDIKVVDTPLDYNILLGRSSLYTMKVASLTIFHLMMLLHEGKITTID